MHEDLHELIAAWLGEEIGDERREQLCERLRIDSEFRAAFVTEARTFAMLQVVQTAEPRWLSLQDELGIADAAAPSLEERVSIALQQTPPLVVVRWWPRLAALAACVAVLFTTTYLLRSWVVSSPAEESSREADRLAVVVGVEDIAWEHSQKPLRQGDSVSAGTLSFSSGKLTLAFLSGVSLHAQGPAKIQIAAPDRIVCFRGNLRAKIVPGAEGFTIETPGAAVVDLGTELGVHVDQGGRSQVVVYEGLAEATLLGPDGSPNRTQTLKAEQSVELDPRNGTMRTVALRELLPSPKLDIPPLKLASDYPQRVLAAKARYYWPSSQVEDGRIRDRVQDGMSLSLVGPIEAMNDGSLSFIESSEPQYLRAEGAWSPPKQFAVELWFASNAFHNSTLAVLQAPPPNRGDLALLELTQRNQETPFKPGRVRFLYRWPPGGTDGVNLYSEPLYIPYQWHHLICQRRNDTLEMFIDGHQVGETHLLGLEDTTTCSLRFGRLKESAPDKHVRQFGGRMAELAVYERALSPNEIRHHAEAKR